MGRTGFTISRLGATSITICTVHQKLRPALSIAGLRALAWGVRTEARDRVGKDMSELEGPEIQPQSHRDVRFHDPKRR